MIDSRTKYNIYAYKKVEYDEVQRKNALTSYKILLSSKHIEYYRELPPKEEIDQTVKAMGCDFYFIDEVVTTTTRTTVDLS
jgi:hypothetical protein